MRGICKLINGEQSSIYVKGPERFFNTSGLWWGGPRSGEKRVYVDSPIVDEQIEWETIFLLRLLKYGIHAEVPQAILEDTEGRKEVIVKEVNSDPKWYVRNPFKHTGPSLEELRTIITRDTGLVPNDYASHNLLRDDEAYLTVIDVNRWEWPLHTDDFTKRLLKAISDKVRKNY